MNRSIDMFNLVASAPSLILGLGISRLLSDAINLFRSRSKARLDWIPIIWATAIFLIQVQFLWGIIELHSTTRQWTVVDFSLLLGISLCLFIASALVFPDIELTSGEKLEDDFIKNGRWALLALFLSELLSISVDFRLFAEKIKAFDIFLLVSMTILPVSYLLFKSRSARAIVTIIYFAVVIWSTWMLSPKQY